MDTDGAVIPNAELTYAQAAAKLQAVVTEAIDSNVEVVARKVSNNPLTYTLTYPLGHKK